jgi:hypothetical protein
MDSALTTRLRRVNNENPKHKRTKLLIEEPWLISNLMHKILIYLHIIHLLKSSTCFEHYSAHFQEVYVVNVYMQPLVSHSLQVTVLCTG